MWIMIIFNSKKTRGNANVLNIVYINSAINNSLIVLFKFN